MHQAADHLTKADHLLVAAALGRRDQRRGVHPFLVSQITWIVHLAAIIVMAHLRRPHRRLPRYRSPATESQKAQTTQYLPG